MIASIELINNYQDKNNYNTFLIDEEKKTIAAELLSRVKLSFNSDIAIYDQNEELVAFVVKNGRNYHPHFISFDGGERKLYNRFEQQTEYGLAQFPMPANISPIHTSYYSASQVFNKAVVTYHRFNDLLVIKSHQNLIEQESGRVIAHIEMSNVLDREYFLRLSQDLDIDVSIASKTDYQVRAQSLSDGTEVPQVMIQQTDKEYIGVMGRETNKGHVYFVARLNKKELNRVLNENRHSFLLLLVLVAAAVLLLMRYLINHGLAHPLAVLMEQIKRIEQRNYSSVVQLATHDELEAISHSVNQLATTVKERETSLELSRKEQEHLSNHDSLTDLPNRRFFTDRLNHALDLAKRKNQRLAVFFLDLDEFKMVNDTLGHDVGDELLIQVADRLRQQVRSADTLARIGGDEFNILVERPRDLHELEVVVSKYLELFRLPFACSSNEIRITASIGVSIYPADGTDSVTLIKNADLAMYKSKDNGRDSFSFFSSELSEQIRERANIIHALQQAVLADDQFELYYQPKVSLHSGKIEGMEALIRWQSPEYGFVLPGRFIPLAEETGLIMPIGEWVLLRGCQDFMQLKKEGLNLNHISLNLSNVQMNHGDMIQLVDRIIGQTGIHPEEIELEITESYIATNVEEAISTLKDFRAMQVRLAVDDFGTGYSSMSYLQKLPITRIKVDKSFVDGLPNDRDSRAIVRAIINLAKSFELEVTAEGVEQEDQFHFLESEGCDEIQGYYFARPMPLSDFKIFYRQQMGDDNVISLDDVRRNE